jgi:hypothetical protein
MRVTTVEGRATLNQDLAVVRDGARAAVIYLPGGTGVPPTCLENVDQRTCERALGGLLVGKLYSLDGNRILSRESEPAVADPLRVGAAWVVLEDGECQLSKVVAAVTVDLVTLQNRLVCNGKESSRGAETWGRGAGLQEVRTEDGQRLVIQQRSR